MSSELISIPQKFLQVNQFYFSQRLYEVLRIASLMRFRPRLTDIDVRDRRNIA